MSPLEARSIGRGRRLQMSVDELRGLPTVVDLQTAGRAWGLSRSRVYEARARGELPFPVVMVAGRMKVTRAALLHSLDEPPASATEAGAVTTATVQEPQDHGNTLRAV